MRRKYLSNSKKILLIVNPSAGKMKSRTGLFDIVEILNKNGFETTVFSTLDKQDATAIVTNHAQKYDMIVCCGGDGTLNEVINGVLSIQSTLPIGYIPTGTTNDMARSLGLAKSIKRAAKDIVVGNLLPIDIGAFNRELYFSYIASFGAFTEVAYTTPQKSKNILGHLAYLLEAIKGLGNIRPVHLKIEYQDEIIEDDFVFGAVTNSTSMAGVFKLSSSDVGLGDGKFEVMLIHNPKNPMELSDVIYGLLSQQYNRKYVSFFHTSNICISGEFPIPWTLDGEYAGNHSIVEIENLHHAVKIITP